MTSLNDRLRRRLELRRSNAAVPHRNRKRYARGSKHKDDWDDPHTEHDGPMPYISRTEDDR